MKKIRLSFNLNLLLLIFSFLLTSSDFCLAQQGGNNTIDHIEEGDIKKEEVQRYIGYEDLLIRYLSLPYDNSMNINERGNFVDIGFIYLMFLPLLLLFVIKSRLLRITMCALMVFIMVISTSNSFIYNVNTKRITKNVEGKLENPYKVDFSSDPIGSIINYYYEFNNLLYIPIAEISSNISGQSDHSTYPILVLLYVLLGFIFFRKLSNSEKLNNIAIAFLFFSYAFFWLVLSTGIIWYGFFMLFLGLALIVILLDKLKKEQSPHYKWLNYSFLSFSGIWIAMCFISRISHISPGIAEDQKGKGMFNPIMYDYNTGKKTEKQLLDRVYPGFYEVINRINRDKKSLVYRVGTSFTYFVDNNHDRVFMDNQLGFFNRLAKRYPNKQDLANALKASGFKYIMIDLHTPTIDKTDEKTLVRKFNQLMDFFKENPNVELLATNRVINVKDAASGQKKQFLGIFGEVAFHGSYAIFELR